MLLSSLVNKMNVLSWKSELLDESSSTRLGSKSTGLTSTTTGISSRWSFSYNSVNKNRFCFRSVNRSFSFRSVNINCFSFGNVNVTYSFDHFHDDRSFDLSTEYIRFQSASLILIRSSVSSMATSSTIESTTTSASAISSSASAILQRLLQP